MVMTCHVTCYVYQCSVSSSGLAAGTITTILTIALLVYRIWVETAHEMVTRSSTQQTMQCLAYPEPGMWCSAMLQWYPAQQCSVTSALPSDRSHQVSNWKKGLAIKYVVIKEGHCYTLTNLPNYGTHTKCGSKLINPQKQSHNLCTIPTKGCLVFTLLYRAWRHTFKYIPNW